MNLKISLKKIKNLRLKNSDSMLLYLTKQTKLKLKFSFIFFE